MIKIIVFDFDGVLVDSNRLKQEAWFKVFKPEEASRELIRNVLTEIKETRYDILREIFRRLGTSAEEIEPLVLSHAQKYNELVQSGISSLGLNLGVKEVLSELKHRFRLYLNSATPEKALLETAGRLSIGDFFEEIYGQSEPESKVKNLKKIIEKENFLLQEVLAVGDGEDDLAAAKTVGCRFIGLANDWNGWKDKEFPLVSNLSEIKNLILKI